MDKVKRISELIDEIEKISEIEKYLRKNIFLWCVGSNISRTAQQEEMKTEKQIDI